MIFRHFKCGRRPLKPQISSTYYVKQQCSARIYIYTIYEIYTLDADEKHTQIADAGRVMNVLKWKWRRCGGTHTRIPIATKCGIRYYYKHIDKHEWTQHANEQCLYTASVATKRERIRHGTLHIAHSRFAVSCARKSLILPHKLLWYQY